MQCNNAMDIRQAMIPLGGIVDADGRAAGPNSLPQAAFLSDLSCPLCGYLGGVGCGKTAAGVTKHMLLAIINGAVSARTGDYLKSIFCEPTYTMIEDIAAPYFWRLFGALEDINGFSILDRYDGQWNKFVLKNGHEILLRSADRWSKLHGPNLTHVTGDELCRWRSIKAHEILITRARDNRAVIRQYNWTSSPEEGHWVQWHICERGVRVPRSSRTPDEWAQSRWYHGRTRDNTSLPSDYDHFLTGNISERALRQLVDGEWLSAEGLVFPEFSRSTHVITGHFPSRPIPVGIGIDHGDVYATAVIIAPMDADRSRWIVLDELVDNFITFSTLLDNIGSVCDAKGYEITSIAIDPNDANISFYAREIRERFGLWPDFSRDDAYRSVAIGRELLHRLLLDRHRAISLLFSSGLVDNIDARQDPEGERGVIISLERFAYPRLRSGGFGSRPVRGRYDHVLDALRYICLYAFPAFHRDAVITVQRIVVGGAGGGR